MKASLSSWLAAACLLPTTLAFPQMSVEQLKTYQEHAKRSPAACPYSEEKRDAGERPFAKDKRAAKFDAKKQRISVSGEHEFLPPSLKAGDQRGPCPGLNALANHGYLPRNGVADMQTIIKATNEVYGMSLDLGGFLAVYGTVFNGNPVSLNPGYSIGGPSRFSQNILNGGGLLGTPSGLSGSHNKYESDVSATRGDLYVTGNNYHVILERLVEYWSAIRENTPAPKQYSALAPFHYKSFQDSEKTNSHFFYSPFAGILVSPAAYSFPPRMMANHSDKYPEGYLSREVFTSFFGVKGSKPGNFKVNQGWERIPENWYRRPVRTFSLMFWSMLPSVDIGDLTGGVFNTAMLLKGDNLECFVMQIIMAAAPDVLGSQFTDVTKPLTPLTDKLRQLLAGKTCPKLQKVNTELFEKFPGYTESYRSYAGVSKGPLRGVIEGIGGILGGLFTTGNKA
ncbi:Aromatic peroxygenase [Fusarium pseudoanthophilum]|uniref:Aromatic peroxygenase n=1 Tax=Fusarium pseudoanthophilum TaxID=48495 RepID=A0A8H5Q5N3_9HYPO|nr:Aromatic peroxygenase [Fusarium pseudoanthophilum]